MGENPLILILMEWSESCVGPQSNDMEFWAVFELGTAKAAEIHDVPISIITHMVVKISVKVLIVLFILTRLLNSIGMPISHESMS